MTRNENIFPSSTDTRPQAIRLLTSIKTNMPTLVQLLKKCEEDGNDGVYRFYHASWKVYARLQPLTTAMVLLFRIISPTPGQSLNDLFTAIVNQVEGREFAHSDNQDWLKNTGPVVAAYFHSRYFLEQMIRFGTELKTPPQLLIPEGWAAILHLYNLR